MVMMMMMFLFLLNDDGDGGYETGSTTFGILEIRITLLFSILYYMRQSITKILILKIFRQK